MHCAEHRGERAAFVCHGCGRELCVDCAARDLVAGSPVVRCVPCGGLASVRRARLEILPWWRMLRVFLGAIFSRGGLVRVTGLALALYVVSLLCDLASYIFFVGPLIALAIAYVLGGGIRVAAYFLVIRSAAFGQVDLPDADDFRGWWDDVFAPLLRFTLATALVWAPAVAWIVHRHGFAWLAEPTPDPAALGLVALGIAYFPAAILAAAIGQETFAMLNPAVTLRLIFRIPAAYFGMLAFLLVCLVVDGFVDYAFLRAEARFGIPVLVPLVGEAAGVVVPLLASMVLGRVVYQNAERIGFLDEADLTAPAVPGAEPRGVLRGASGPPAPRSSDPGPPGSIRSDPGDEPLRLALHDHDDAAALAAYRALCAAGAEPAGLDAASELRLASALERAGAIADATVACRRALHADPQGPLAARAVFTFARLLDEGLHDPAGAAQAYRLLLERFPHDALAPHAQAALRRQG